MCLACFDDSTEGTELHNLKTQAKEINKRISQHRSDKRTLWCDKHVHIIFRTVIVLILGFSYIFISVNIVKWMREERQECRDEYYSYVKHECLFTNMTVNDTHNKYIYVQYEVVISDVWNHEPTLYTYTGKCHKNKVCKALTLSGFRTCFVVQSNMSIHLKRSFDDLDKCEQGPNYIGGIVYFALTLVVIAIFICVYILRRFT